MSRRLPSLRLSPGMRLFGADPSLDEDQRLGLAVRAVLETRPGRIPWCPEFGCDLERYLGLPLTATVLDEVRWRVGEAITRWVPGVAIAALEVDAVRVDEGRISGPPDAPLAEASLLALGSQAALSIRVALHTPRGPREVSAVLSP